NSVGAFDEARSCADEAFGLATAVPVRVAAMEMLANLAWFSGAAATARRLLEEAIEAAGDDPHLQAPLYAHLVRYSLVLDLPSVAVNGEIATSLLDRDRD